MEPGSWPLKEVEQAATSASPIQAKHFSDCAKARGVPGWRSQIGRHSS